MLEKSVVEKRWGRVLYRSFGGKVLEIQKGVGKRVVEKSWKTVL